MGIWSRPIFTTHTPSSGECQVDISKIPAEVVEKVRHCGYFETEREGLISIDTIHQETYDTAKIWGYFSRDAVNGWASYLGCVLDQNPNVESVQLHWENVDDFFPYFLEMEQKARSLVLYSCPPQRYYFYTTTYEEESQEIMPHFNEEIYRKAWFLVRDQFRRIVLSLH